MKNVSILRFFPLFISPSITFYIIKESKARKREMERTRRRGEKKEEEAAAGDELRQTPSKFTTYIDTSG